MKNFLKEPLLHFLLIGAGLFLLFGWRGDPAPRAGGEPAAQTEKVIVAGSDIERLVRMFERTWQRPPSEKEKQGLIDSFVRDEIYYREARVIGLDRDDSVIRRRLRMKMEYIFEDIGSQVEPTEQELLAYMKRHPDDYLQDHQVAFRHVYVNTDKRGEAAEPFAQKILAELNRGNDYRTTGDPFFLENRITLLSLQEVEYRFGKSFAEGIRHLEPGQWQGPIRSGYGLHLVIVDRSVPQRWPQISEVRDHVQRDWSIKRQKELKDAAYARLRQRYQVEIEEPPKLETAGIARTPGRVVTR